MNRKAIFTVLMAFAAVPAMGLAQDTPAPAPIPPPGSTEPVIPAPEPTPAPAPAPLAEPTAEPTAEATPEAPAEEEEEHGVAGWFRIDLDSGGLQLWAGATHPLSDSVGLASDIYVYGTAAEFDIGPSFSAGPVLLTPMIGYQIDFLAQRSLAIVPQLYTYIDSESVYFESWIQVYLYSPFDDTVAADFFHTRDFILFKVSDQVALGPEIDINLALNNKALKFGKTVYFLPIGPHLKLFYGEASTLELFVGYDVAGEDQGVGKLAGRFTFVQTW